MLQFHPWSEQHGDESSTEFPECQGTENTSSIYVTLLCETDELILGVDLVRWANIPCLLSLEF